MKPEIKRILSIALVLCGILTPHLAQTAEKKEGIIDFRGYFKVFFTGFDQAGIDGGGVLGDPPMEGMAWKE